MPPKLFWFIIIILCLWACNSVGGGGSDGRPPTLGETYPIDGEVDFSGFATVYELEVGVALKPLLYSIQRNYLIQKNAHALSS